MEEWRMKDLACKGSDLRFIVELSTVRWLGVEHDQRMKTRQSEVVEGGTTVLLLCDKKKNKKKKGKKKISDKVGRRCGRTMRRGEKGERRKEKTLPPPREKLYRGR
jgi:hypothetical protein